jgi:DNA-binding NarL/FixJ family response regulator
LRILVADDHPAVRRFVCEVLTTEGWQICGQASNGREAVEIAVQEHPDVVVLDLSMPELNGLDAARRILKAMPQAIVLMLTMYESEELTQAVLESGVAACLLKSDLQHLVQKVRSLQGSAPS